MNEDKVEVYLDDRLVGTLAETADHRVAFAYWGRKQDWNVGFAGELPRKFRKKRGVLQQNIRIFVRDKERYRGETYPCAMQEKYHSLSNYPLNILAHDGQEQDDGVKQYV